MEILFILISAIIFFIIAELFGRSKHIGRWWSFLLLLNFILPGIIAILLSPSAKNEPTKGTKIHIIVGWIVLILLGFIGLIPQLFQFANGFPLNGAILSIPISFIFIGAYLIQLGNGKIVNKEPKYYFDGLTNNYSENEPIKTASEAKITIASKREEPITKKETQQINTIVEVKTEQEEIIEKKDFSKERVALNFAYEKQLLTENEYLEKVKLIDEREKELELKKQEELEQTKKLEFEKELNKRTKPLIEKLDELKKMALLTENEYFEKVNQIIEKCKIELENKNEIKNKIKKYFSSLTDIQVFLIVVVIAVIVITLLAGADIHC